MDFSNAFALHEEDAGLSNRLFARMAGTLKGLRPVFFGPRTLGRTWGTSREVGWVAQDTLAARLRLPDRADQFGQASWIHIADRDPF